jgi:hypothetical protein
MIPQRFYAKLAAAAAAAAIVALGGGVDAQEQANKPKRPKIAMRSSPPMAFTPATLTFTVELKDGDNDFEEYYCASVEWDWADGTRSESTDDCEPYEAGKSEIRRRYSIQHKYNIAGVYDVRFSLKQRDKTVVSARTKVIVREGMTP